MANVQPPKTYDPRLVESQIASAARDLTSPDVSQRSIARETLQHVVKQGEVAQQYLDGGKKSGRVA